MGGRGTTEINSVGWHTYHHVSLCQVESDQASPWASAGSDRAVRDVDAGGMAGWRHYGVARSERADQGEGRGFLL